MGRRRGKTVSSGDAKKPLPVSLPPMQIAALPPSTAQRLANMKPSTSASSSTSTVGGVTPARGSSRATAQTASSLQRQSDASLRARGQALPTIAGSPSVGTAGSNSTITKEMQREAPPSVAANVSSSLPKETPTKIPRIHSRTSTVTSPALNKSMSNNRRASLIIGGGQSSSNEPSPTPAASLNEFGVFENGGDSAKATLGTATQRQSIRASPSSSGGSRVPRQSTGPPAATVAPSSSSGIPRKGARDSISFGGLRKSSTSSVASISSVAPSGSDSGHHHHRFSALSPSKGLKLLSPKVSLARTSNSTSSSGIHQTMSTPSSSRQSLSTPSPSPVLVDDDEVAGDEEMMQYIKRLQQKKLANGATQNELDELLRFPEPISPIPPMNPASLLKGPQGQQLSDFEWKEIMDYPSVYYYGQNSEKKMAHPDRQANNYGYDDDRGDYQIVSHDHLAYRYEVLDTLGKGSFGQVLSCRDHCTGQSVAIKIIRNKKRFHHQALVEIKILDNLRKWDAEEKHHVIKMTEHFYFRNHLCIAMELLSINLYELIKANGFVGFTTALIRRFTSQMLLSLTLMRHHRIVHCDLKPENVLLKHPAKSAIKVIDFGSSCFEHEKIYTYIQSRFYRSPEVILGMNYHMAIDMWSLGCILAELKTGFPIFPGENEQEQLSCIMEVLGIPDKEFINRSSRKRLFFDSTGAPRPVVNSKGRRRRPGTKTLQQVLRCDDEQFIDFIAKCLVWDPERRLKPQNALKHPFVLASKQQRSRVPTTPSGSSSRTLASLTASASRSKPMETPKKSQISAPAPLSARSIRTTTTNATTPSNSTSAHSLTSSRSYRASQAQSSGYHSSRTLNGFTVR
ncbi:kinase-like domain-containing protein [Vararia minispora EC-137]|uniref:Kinase-like domain-containing protein n=1 Tax=Vararia minispora EC-137 TaxID=1314806 RepID=A0ACB8QC98_9AGAM|nr:kinase-like domain-containing protein [Vararia minispora EC-137]